MIIVEGADNVGKTTLVKQLLEMDPELHEIKRKRFKPEKSETIGTSYIQCLIPEDGDRVKLGNGIVDRLLASEFIYGNLFRNKVRVTPAEHLATRLLLMAHSAFVVFCDPPNESIMNEWTSREQLYDDPIRIAESYRHQIYHIFSPLPVIKYDWTCDSADTQLRFLVKVHRQLQERMSRTLGWWSANPYGVGRLEHPDYILIGDCPSPRAVTPVPFSNGPAGSFLSWSLDHVQEMLGNCYITNAKKGTDRDLSILREELTFLVSEGTTVIALGNMARDAYEAVKDSTPTPEAFHHIPHPMYWRRFRHREADRYPQMLKELC